MTSSAIGLDLKFHSRILPIALVIMGVYCLVKRNSISCTSSGIDSSVLESYCPGLGLYIQPRRYKHGGDDVAHPSVTNDRYEKKNVPLHSYFGLTLLVWSWVFYSSGELWKHMEGRFLKSLHDNKAPQKEILKNPGKCRLYMIKYLTVLALAILQLILFMMITSTALFGKTNEKTIEEDQEIEKSTWIAIANGKHVLPLMAQCTYHHFGPHGSVQKYDAQCHLEFNKNLEIIYLCCMVFSIISLVHLVMAFLYNIIVSCVNLLQVLHLCLFGSYTWTEARDCLARCEMFSGKWMLLQMVLPITEKESNQINQKNEAMDSMTLVN